ncbi:hypothetical protein [Legionella fairfieldensis]|uniref:hypothetical protein n=1 Tax=Legionella fairfieldensis TaxID=45064 RepID=UPI00048B395F|nr:hypothetical protein [Legionella fairfieldensis]
MWETLFKRYWQVAILKESPGNTPSSSFLLFIVSFLFVSLIVLQSVISEPERQDLNFLRAILAVLTLLCSYFVYTYILLKIYHKAGRTLQALTTLIFSHLLIHFFAFPLLLVTPMLINNQLNQGLALVTAIIYLIFTLLLIAWQFLVTVHIYKHTLESDSLTAVLASFGLLACNILTVSLWQ